MAAASWQFCTTPLRLNCKWGKSRFSANAHSRLQHTGAQSVCQGTFGFGSEVLSARSQECTNPIHNEFHNDPISIMNGVLSACSERCTDLQSAWVIEIAAEIQYAVCEAHYAKSEIQYAVSEIQYAVSNRRTGTVRPRQVILLELGIGSVLS